MKSGKSFAWSVSGDNRLMALSAAFNDDPLAVTLSFMPEYAERFDWIVTQLKDWMFLVTTCEFLNDKDAVFSKLDECLQEIRGFEDDLNQKIQKNNDSNR